MSTEEELKRQEGRLHLISEARNKADAAACAELVRQERCFRQSPSKCIVLSFTRLKLLPWMMLAALKLPDYFKFDTTKLANRSIRLHTKFSKLTGTGKECVVLDLRSKIDKE